MKVDRKSEEDLKEQISMAFRHTAGIPNKSHAEEGIEYHTRAGKNRLFELVMQIVFADRKAQATALLEKGPEREKHDCATPTCPRFQNTEGFNRSDARWRSIIKEQLS